MQRPLHRSTRWQRSCSTAPIAAKPGDSSAPWRRSFQSCSTCSLCYPTHTSCGTKTKTFPSRAPPAWARRRSQSKKTAKVKPFIMLRRLLQKINNNVAKMEQIDHGRARSGRNFNRIRQIGFKIGEKRLCYPLRRENLADRGPKGPTFPRVNIKGGTIHIGCKMLACHPNP